MTLHSSESPFWIVRQTAYAEVAKILFKDVPHFCVEKKADWLERVDDRVVAKELCMERDEFRAKVSAISLRAT